MHSPETSPEARGDRRARTSRRTFLLLAGSAAGVGLSGPASGARGDDAAGAVSVDASPSQRAAARDAVDALGEPRSTDAVSLRVAETTAGLRRFTAGEVDVVVGSRPALPAERSRATENGVDYDRRELPTAAAALRHPESGWVDCLSPAGVAETWAGDGAVETWAEVAPSDATGAVTRHEPSDGSNADVTTDKAAAGDAGDGSRRPEPAGTPLVRGVRAYQYASGFGGVGYYEPDSDWIDRLPETAADADARTRLVRLGFLYVDRASLEREPVRAFVREFARQSERRVGAVPYFANPVGNG